MISLCITTYKRDSLLLESFQQVANDDRISEIVIVDDCSPDNYMIAIKEFVKSWPKIKVFRNSKNLGCYFNKREAVSKASNEWVILLDSDNVITPQYLDSLMEYNTNHGWSKDTILAPDFACPTFDYRHFSDITFNKSNVRKFIDHKRFDCLINTANYFFHRDEYLRLFDRTREPWTADTIFMNYNWLKAGNNIHVLKGLQYFHRTDDFKGQEGSHYKTHNKKTNGFAKKVEQMLSQLR